MKPGPLLRIRVGVNSKVRVESAATHLEERYCLTMTEQSGELEDKNPKLREYDVGEVHKLVPVLFRCSLIYVECPAEFETEAGIEAWALVGKSGIDIDGTEGLGVGGEAPEASVEVDAFICGHMEVAQEARGVSAPC